MRPPKPALPARRVLFPKTAAPKPGTLRIPPSVTSDLPGGITKQQATAAYLAQHAGKYDLPGGVSKAGLEAIAHPPQHGLNFLERLALAPVDIAQSIYGLPGQGLQAAESLGHDVGAIVHGHAPTSTYRKVLKPLAVGTAHTLAHPLERPGITALTLWGLKSVPGGAIGRAGAVSAVTREAATTDLATAVGRLSKADERAYRVLTDPEKHLPGIDHPTAHRIANPSRPLLNVLDIDHHLAAQRTKVLQALGSGKVEPKRAGVGAIPRAVGASKPAQIARAAVKTPLPKQRTLTVPGPHGGAGVVVHPVASKDYLINLFQRHVIDRRRQKKLDKTGILPGSHGLAEAVQVPAAEQGLEVRAAMNAIDQVHSVRSLPSRVAVIAEKELEGALGRAVSVPHGPGRLRPVAVEFDPRQHGVQATVAHEMGHVVHKLLEGQDHHVLAAIARSEGTKRLAQHGGAFGNYGMKLGELFARAYTQYVATRAKSQPIMEGIRAFDTHIGQRNVPAFHWTEEDFKPIAAAFDRLFTDLGWRRKGGPAEQAAERPLARLVSAEATVGRELRASRRVQDAKELAAVSRLERFGTSKPARILRGVTAGQVERPAIVNRPGANRLTAGEQKAIDIRASGVTPRVHVRYHAAQIRRLRAERAALSGEENILAKVAGVRRIRAEQRRHEAQIALSRLASHALREPRPALAQALGETKHVIGQRERALNIDEQMRAHRIGARATELEAGVGKRLLRPRTREEAQARLDMLDQRWEDLVDRTIEAMKGGQPFDPAETRFRNTMRGRATRRARGRAVEGRVRVGRGPQTQLQEMRQRAEETLLRLAQERRDQPWADRLLKERTEAAALRRALEETHPVFGTGARDDFGMVRATQPPRQETPLQELGRLEPDLARIARRLKALGVRRVGNRVEVPEGVDVEMAAQLFRQHDAIEQRMKDIHEQIVTRGHQAIEEGAFYLPSQSLIKLRRISAFARRPGPLGLGPPKKLPELSHAYTGALQRTGNFRTDATGLAAESYRRAQAYATLERAHGMLLHASHPTREAAGPFAIPIRTTYTIPQRLRNALLKADQGSLTPQDLHRLTTRDVEAAVRELFPDPRELDAAEIQNVRWIDSRILGGVKTEHDYGGNLGKAADVINAPFRATLLYTKPAYALNLLQNLGTNAIQQGVFTPINITRALRLGRDLGSEDQHIILTAVGQGLSRSIEPGAGVGKRALVGAGEWWNAVIDRYPRAASWLHEARREGFNTPTKIHALIHDERMKAKYEEITRRANREAIDYGSLTPFERNVLKRAIFFYPWIRGATLYSLRFPVEHPVQAAVYAQAGQEGYQRNRRVLGRVPSYLEGATPVAGGLSNFQNINTFATPAEIGRAVTGPFVARSPGAGDLAQELSPAAAAIYTLLSGKTQLGYDVPGGKSRIAAVLEQATGGLPIPRVLGLSPRSKVPPTAPAGKQPVFADTTRNRVGQYLAGGAFPRSYNKPALQARGEQEYRSTLAPRDKILYDSQKEIAQAKADAKGLKRTLPPLVAGQYALKRETLLARLDVAKKADVDVRYLNDVQRAQALVAAARKVERQLPGVTRAANVVLRAAKAGEYKRWLGRFTQVYGTGRWTSYVNHHKR